MLGLSKLGLFLSSTALSSGGAVATPLGLDFSLASQSGLTVILFQHAHSPAWSFI